MSRSEASRGRAWLPVKGGSRPIAARSRGSRVRMIEAAMTALAAGIVLGLVLTAIAIRNGGDIGATTLGGWRFAPQEGTPNLNPYQRAVLARTGTIPMSTGQGVALTATRDLGGKRLDRHCRYRIGGSVPRARFWTLGVVDSAGIPLANPAERYAFNSSDVLRDESGDFTIVISPDVQPGNWLPLSGTGRFKLVLRLYDSGLAGYGARELRGLSVPTIVAGPCA